MCVRIVPGEGSRVERKQMRAAGTSDGSPTRIERLVFGHQSRSDEPGAWLSKRLVEGLRGGWGGRGAGKRRAARRSEGNDVVKLPGDAQAAAVLQSKYGGALSGANADLDHGFRGTAVRCDGVERGTPDGSAQNGLEGLINDVAADLPKCTHEPLQFVPSGRLGH